MQIFQLHFNPNNKKKTTVDTFYYEPQDVYEKRLGALAVGGEIKNVSSPNKTLLNNLAYKIKSTYHALPTRTQQEALIAGLNEGNKFLSEKSIDGSLSVAVLSIKNNKLEFSKIGNIKILISRNGEITDIGKNAEDKTENFGSIATGKIKKEDKLIILTKNIHKEFIKEGLLSNFTKASPISEKKLEKISEAQEQKFPKIPGICLLVDFSIKTLKSNDTTTQKRFSIKENLFKLAETTQKTIIFIVKKIREESVSGFKYLKNNVGPTLRKTKGVLVILAKDIKKFFLVLFSKTKNKWRGKRRKAQKEETSEIKEEEIKKKRGSVKNNFLKLKSFVVKEGKIGYQNLKKTTKKIKNSNYFPKFSKIKIPKNKISKRNIYLAGLLLFIILIGSIVTHFERGQQIEKQSETLSKINFSLNNIDLNQDNSFTELKYHYDNLGALINEGIILKSKAEKIKNKAANKMLELSNTVFIENPKVVLESKEVIPSKLEVVNNDIYLYNPLLSDAEKYNLESKESLIRPVNLKQGGLFLATSFQQNKILFFNRPDQLITLNGGQERYTLTPSIENHNYQQIEAFQNYIYFLEKRDNQIIRYNINDLTAPQRWIEERKPGRITSFTVDGSIWLLKENNEIWEYENNRPLTNSGISYKEIFPFPEKFTKIATSHESPLFILEPKNSRIVIFSKEGELIKQIIFPNLDNIKDFVIFSQTKIYLLDNQKVYSIDLNL